MFSYLSAGSTSKAGAQYCVVLSRGYFVPPNKGFSELFLTTHTGITESILAGYRS